MSQFGGGKPPGQWGRPAPPGGPAQIPGFSVNVGGFPMVGMGVPMGMVNQAAFSSSGVLGMQGIMGAVPQQSLGQQQQVRPQQPQQQVNNGLQQAAASGKNQRTFVGVVTKMLDTYGFVDDDVFFQHSVIRGSHPRVGDKVMVEASYNPAMPFKWNAFRIQLLNAASQAQAEPVRQNLNTQPAQQRSNEPTRWSASSNTASDRNGRDSPNNRGTGARRHSPRRSPPRRTSSPKRARDTRDTREKRSPARRPSPRRASPPRQERAERAERGDRKRERSPSGSVAPSVRRDSASPPRRRARIIPRYECRVQRPALLAESVSGSNLRHRYGKLYLPSDYVDLTFDWVKSVQLDLSLDLNLPIQFHIFHKDVEICLPEGDVLPELEPEDADHRYQVKILLLSHLGKADIVKKAFCLMPDGSTDDQQEPQSLFKNLSFLVGVRGKETMGIGGCWSPSLDGPNPSSPATMIKTAVRTTRALTGIDLSSVSQWFSLVQVRYYRADKQRVDHVNLLLPDTQSLSPDDASWAAAEKAIGEQLKVKVEAIEAMKIEEEEPIVVQPEEEIKEENVEQEQVETQPEQAEIKVEQEADSTLASENGDEKMETDEAAPSANQGPTNWSNLDPKSMKVAELRVELELRGLETKGIKTLLVQRLQTALDTEKATEVKEAKDVEMKDASDAAEEKAKTDSSDPAASIAPPVEETRAKTEAEAKKEKEEEEKKRKKEEALEKEKKEKKDSLERHYQMPKEKKILIFPSKTYKGGKFDCKVMSLSSLLDYRSDDNKESQFEVSLFAEAFREMIERNAAFTIYDTLVNCGDKDIEKKRRDEARERVVEPPKEENGEKKDEEKKEKDDKKEKDGPVTERVELKSVVANRTVYEAFSIFDQNLCGYVTEKDIEEILYNGEFGISRGQIQKLSKKLSVRDKINYRHLTDVLTDLDGNVRHTPGGADDVVETDDLILGYGINLAKSTEEKSVGDSNGQAVTASSDGVVVIKGNVVNVPQKLKLLKQAEQERDNARATLNEQISLIEQLREAKVDIEKKRKDIEASYQKSNKRLTEATFQLKNVQDDHANLKQALLDCKRHSDRIFAVVEKAVPPPKKEKKEEKEKSSEKSSDKKEDKPDSKDTSTNEESGTEIVLAEEIGEDEEKTGSEETAETVVEETKNAEEEKKE